MALGEKASVAQLVRDRLLKRNCDWRVLNVSIEPVGLPSGRRDHIPDFDFESDLSHLELANCY
jgi:hypothetical protein